MGITIFSPGPLFTTKEVAARLGMQRHQIEYRTDRGIIADSKLRIGNRRLFTEEEIGAIEQLLKSE